MSTPVAFNSSAELQAARVNFTENNRSTQHQKHFQRMQKHAERIANNKIRQVQDGLEHIQNSSGALSEFKMPKEKHKPFFMYGRRTESRKMSKRIARLRYLHQQKQSQELEKLKLPSDIPGEECTILKSEHTDKSPDEIFQDILEKVDDESRSSDSGTEHNGNACMQSAPNQSPVWKRRVDESTATRQIKDPDLDFNSRTDSKVVLKDGGKERILHHPHTFPILSSPPLVSSPDNHLPNLGSLSLLDEQNKSQILYRKKYGIPGHSGSSQHTCTCMVSTVSEISKDSNLVRDNTKISSSNGSTVPRKQYVYTTHDRHHVMDCPNFYRQDSAEQSHRTLSPVSTKSQLSFSSSVRSKHGMDAKPKMDGEQNGCEKTRDKFAFKRSSIYEPTAASRQRSLCSLINRSMPPPRNFVL